MAKRTNQLKSENINRISSILAGVSGEYFVAGELSRRGYICSITLKNTKGIDILVTNEAASKTLGIQVKTNQIDKKEWILNSKAEAFYSDDLFYVFVNLVEIGKIPEYYIVPSKVVADSISKSHKEWLGSKGRKGQAHNDNTLRKFADKEQLYLEKWDLLEI